MANSVFGKTLFVLACLVGIGAGEAVFAHGGHGGGHGGGWGGGYGGFHGGYGGYGGYGGWGGHHGGYGGWGGYGGYGGYGLGYGGYGGYGLGYGFYGGFPGYGYGWGGGTPYYGYGLGYGYPWYGYGYGYPWYAIGGFPGYGYGYGFWGPGAYYSYRQPTYLFPLQPSRVFSGSSPVSTSPSIVIIQTPKAASTLPPAPAPISTAYDNGEIVLFSPPSNTTEAKYTLNGMAYTMKPGTYQKFKNDRDWIIDVTNADGTSTKFTLAAGNYKFRQAPTGISLYTTKESPAISTATDSPSVTVPARPSTASAEPVSPPAVTSPPSPPAPSPPE